VQFKAFTREGDLLPSSEAESPILRNINVEIKNGTLVAIVGTVGTRISAFLECILGEMEKIAGKVCCLSNPL
jgi:ATP-binding cassette subfamily C (CFTR/MRP) protein 1